jgi:hypothetical protein
VKPCGHTISDSGVFLRRLGTQTRTKNSRQKKNSQAHKNSLDPEMDKTSSNTPLLEAARWLY